MTEANTRALFEACLNPVILPQPCHPASTLSSRRRPGSRIEGIFQYPLDPGFRRDDGSGRVQSVREGACG